MSNFVKVDVLRLKDNNHVRQVGFINADNILHFYNIEDYVEYDGQTNEETFRSKRCLVVYLNSGILQNQTGSIINVLESASRFMNRIRKP